MACVLPNTLIPAAMSRDLRFAFYVDRLSRVPPKAMFMHHGHAEFLIFAFEEYCRSLPE